MRSETTPSRWFVIGLDSGKKRRHYASTILLRNPEKQNREQVISSLKEIREKSLKNIKYYVDQFVHEAGKTGTSVSFIDDPARVIEYIKKVMGSEKKILAVNRSSAINELVPRLEKNKFEIIDTYLAEEVESEPGEKQLNYFWQLPEVSFDAAFESFVVQEQDTPYARKDNTALLGVSAASAEDGSILFLQHSTNIGQMLQEARRLILLVPLDKIVCTKEEAIFQVKCMGVFGLESVVIHLKPPSQNNPAIQFEKIDCSGASQEVHIIVFDNGRMNIAEDEHFDRLLTCIGCRACSKNCPMVDHFSKDPLNFPRKYLWSYLLGLNHSLEMCIGCGMCYFNCPMDINIPLLISRARGKSLTKLLNRIKSKLLYDPYPFMLLGSRVPFLVNSILRNKLVRNLMEKAVGYQKDAWIPHENAVPFDEVVQSRDSKEGLP